MGNTIGVSLTGTSQNASNSDFSGGNKYNPVLRFDPDVLNHHTPDKLETLPEYNHDNLLKIVEDFPLMKEERILKVSIYKHKLAKHWQNNIPIISSLLNVVFYRFHAFVVFETDQGWFYSLEKYQQRVSLQRARKIRGVRDLDSWCPRLNVTMHDDAKIEKIKSDDGKGTVEDLIKVIVEENLVSTDYHWMTENCKHLAACIYNRVSKGNCNLAWSEEADLPHQCLRGAQKARILALL